LNNIEAYRRLKDEIQGFKGQYPGLKDDAAFVLWFMRAYIDDAEEKTFLALTGESGDKGADAVLLDEKARKVHIIQGKFRQGFGNSTEDRGDVLSFADLAEVPWMPRSQRDLYFAKLSETVATKLAEAIRYIKERDYGLLLYFVTTARCSKTICDEATSRVKHSHERSKLEIFEAKQVPYLFKKYWVGDAPAIPELFLNISADHAARSEGEIHRFDPAQGLDSWVFSMNSKDVGDMYTNCGTRLFARNIRGYLGRGNEINKSMEKTIREEPGNFWYYNNGITLVCDKARHEEAGGKDVLIVNRPQVINGQQTTRTLSETSSKKASVLVKVIHIPKENLSDDEYADLVSSIVRATNFQNYIKPSDLITNDVAQVFLERELRKHGYQYIRKRQARSEAKAQWRTPYKFQISKERLAQAITACDIDPSVVLKGTEALFDERYYRSIFSSSRSVSSYLTRFWAANRVLSLSKGHRERAYAKWLVLYYVWEKISSKGAFREKAFIHACEHYTNDVQAYKLIRQLELLINLVFRASIDFYRRNRGTGDDIMDRQSFFKQTTLEGRNRPLRNLFIEFCDSKHNRARKSTYDRLYLFAKLIADYQY